jgi:hypothetical protein
MQPVAADEAGLRDTAALTLALGADVPRVASPAAATQWSSPPALPVAPASHAKSAQRTMRQQSTQEQAMLPSEVVALIHDVAFQPGPRPSMFDESQGQVRHQLTNWSNRSCPLTLLFI